MGPPTSQAPGGVVCPPKRAPGGGAGSTRSHRQGALGVSGYVRQSRLSCGISWWATPFRVQGTPPAPCLASRCAHPGRAWITSVTSSSPDVPFFSSRSSCPLGCMDAPSPPACLLTWRGASKGHVSAGTKVTQSPSSSHTLDAELTVVRSSGNGRAMEVV